MKKQNKPLNNTIIIRGEINKEMVCFVKKQYRAFKKDFPQETRIHVFIDSHGGDVFALRVLSRLLFYGAIKKNYYFIAHIIHAESAALSLALNMHERHVIEKSTGQIHLPIPKQHITVEQKTTERIVKKAADFISRRTNIAVEDVYRLNEVPLAGIEMYLLGIATHFEPTLVYLKDERVVFL